MTKDEAKKEIERLVARFREHRDEYHLPEYNETKTRQDFVNPFFKALGWDVDNSGDASEAYREVIHEDKVKVNGKMKAPDYGFRLQGSADKRLFYVEAKKPSVLLKVNKEASFQLRRYGLSAQVHVSILTNFEEFVIYDCSRKPDFNDSAKVARLKYIPFEKYEEEFDFIYDTFSRDAIIRGRFDKFVKSDTFKKGSQVLDKYFVETLNDWRTRIATSIARNNLNLNEDDINFAVQLTIDRIIFLRFCEDRGVEPYGQMQKAIASGNSYSNLLHIFQLADDKYNSGLFDFKKDTISHNLKVDNKILKGIAEDIYYPKSSYDFRIMPVEILGNAYEQFLGKVIRITKAHHAVIDDKPEVRKAGGVYYTPQYIVKYIVKNTVGKLVEGKAPKEIEKIKIVDPACGSGSFLIGAFQFLLDYHTLWYTDKGYLTKTNKKDSPLTPDGKLTSAEKKKILLNNIYGVDIDTNAVEVTKLSLLLKCMEGETEASIKQQLSVLHERVLPDLDNNIKSGNSLIDEDFYGSEIDYGYEKKIKPFSWKRQFTEVFKHGGFDAVIGNPPYVKIQTLQENNPKQVFEYFKLKYNAALSGNYDLYVLFIETGFKLLSKNGFLGFIQPHKFFQSEFGEGLRNYLAVEKALSKVVHFGAEQIFADATTYTCLLFLDRIKNTVFDFIVVNKPVEWAINYSLATEIKSTQPKVGEKWHFSSDKKQAVIDKLNKIPQTLDDITRKIFVGLQTSADKIYVLKIKEWKKNTVLCYSNSLDEKVEIEKGLVKPFLMGKDVKRYEIPSPHNVVIFPYLIKNGKAVLMDQSFIKSNFPLGWNYLLRNKTELEDREKKKMKGISFYAYIYPKNLAEFETTKICTPEIAIKPQLTIDQNGTCYHTTKVYSFAFKSDVKEDLKYFLGVLNSPVLWFFISSTGYVLRGGYFTFKTEYLKPFRIKTIDFKNKSEVKSHDEIVKHVDLLLKLNAELPEATLPEKIEQIKSRIGYSEDKINELVYELYGLTEEEIKIVEG